MLRTTQGENDYFLLKNGVFLLVFPYAKHTVHLHYTIYNQNSSTNLINLSNVSNAMFIRSKAKMKKALYPSTSAESAKL